MRRSFYRGSGFRVGVAVGERQAPAVTYGHDTQAEAEQGAEGEDGHARQLEQRAGDNDRGAGERSDGVKLRAQYHGNLRNENVARHAAADAREHAEQDAGDRREPE